jgi:ribosomal-protein-alanine N-acetyltransferase
MTRPPENLETDRLWLRPIQLSDAESILTGWAGESNATLYMNFRRHERLSETEAFAARCVDCWKPGAAYPWAIVAKATGALLGSVELRVSPPKADFGYIFSEWAWGQGFGTEAASAVVSWAITQPSIFRVWATCHPANIASARVLEKSGLAYEATLANWEARPQRGEAAGSSAVYAIIKSSS